MKEQNSKWENLSGYLQGRIQQLEKKLAKAQSPTSPPMPSTPSDEPKLLPLPQQTSPGELQNLQLRLGTTMVRVSELESKLAAANNRIVELEAIDQAKAASVSAVVDGSTARVAHLEREMQRASAMVSQQEQRAKYFESKWVDSHKTLVGIHSLVQKPTVGSACACFTPHIGAQSGYCECTKVDFRGPVDAIKALVTASKGQLSQCALNAGMDRCEVAQEL